MCFQYLFQLNLLQKAFMSATIHSNSASHHYCLTFKLMPSLRLDTTLPKCYSKL